MEGHGGVVVAFILAPFGGSGAIHTHPPALPFISITGEVLVSLLKDENPLLGLMG
jgi:hypothetical protein